MASRTLSAWVLSVALVQAAALHLAAGAAAAQQLPTVDLNAHPLGERTHGALCEAYQRTIKGVVRIEVQTPKGTSGGSGFLIGTQGVVVTSYDVVAGATAGRVFLDGKAREIQGLLAFDRAQGLALVKIEPQGLALQPLELAASDPAAEARVLLVGHEDGFVNPVVAGPVVAVCRGPDLLATYPKAAGRPCAQAGTEWIRTAAASTPGVRGGPLVALADGRVVGVNTWCLAPGEDGAADEHLAASVSALRRLILEKAGFEPAPLAAVAEKEHPDGPPQAPVGDVAAAGILAPGKGFSRQEAGDAILRARTALKCQRCSGTGKVKATRTQTYKVGVWIRKRVIEYMTDCPECGGRGAQWTAEAWERVADMVERVLLPDAAVTAEQGVALRDSARETLRQGCINKAGAAEVCRRQAPDGRPAGGGLGRPVVFYAVYDHRLGQSSRHVVRLYGNLRPVVVEVAGPAGTARGQYCLVAGLDCGAKVAYVGGASRYLAGVVALAIEPIR